MSKRMLKLSVVLLAAGSIGLVYVYSKAHQKSKKNKKDLAIHIF